MFSIFQYIIVLTATFIFLALIFLHIRKIRAYHLYDFRNILIAALCPLCLGMIVSLVLEYPESSNFSISHMLLNFPAQFANMSIVLIGVMGVYMAVSNAVLILHEGMAVKNTIGTMLELVWLSATILVYALVCNARAHLGSASGIIRFLFIWIPYFLYCLIDYGQCLMIGMMIMGWVAAHGKSTYDKDFIIIPGCCISKTGGLLPLLRGRVNRAIRYSWEQEIATGRPVRFIPSGGKGEDEIMSEGSAMELYLLSHSAEDYEVFPEKESSNTAENFLLSARIIREMNPKAKVAFATTNYHVLRCGMLAKRAGLNAEGLASSTKWYFWPNGFAREVVAIANMTRRYQIFAVTIILVLSLLISITC